MILSQIKFDITSNKISETPNRPKSLKVNNVTSNSASISWEHSTSDGELNDDVLQYFIDVKEEKDDEYLPIGRVDGRTNHFELEYLKSNKLYRVRIRAKNSIGFSEPLELPCVIQLKPQKGTPLEK